MQLFDSGPLVAQPTKDIRGKLLELEQAARALTKELERRGEREEWRWGFPTSRRIGGGYEMVYAVCKDSEEAAKAWAKQSGDDLETARYRIHKVFLGKDDNVET